MQISRLPKLLLGFSVPVIIYFIYHAYHGERGLIAHEQLSIELATLKETYSHLHNKRVNLEAKISSLGAGDGQIDPDLLTEHARELGYVFPDEIMVTE